MVGGIYSVFPGANGASIALIVVSVFAALCLVVMILRNRGGRSSSFSMVGHDDTPPGFLFDGTILIDASASGHRILQSVSAAGGDWAGLLGHLATRFPAISSAADTGPEAGEYLSADPADPSRLEVERWGSMVRLTIRSEREEPVALHPGAIRAMEDEIHTLRLIGQNAPILIWQEDRTGTITWANAAYLTLADRFADRPPHAPPIWPPCHVFDRLPITSAEDDCATDRLSIRHPGAAFDQWFEVKSLKQGTGRLNFATDIGDVVSAEDRNRQFIQTITKTFAQLSIGLAIFDRKRRLVIFNPALLDLTRLPISFLSGQPTIRAFLDRLRDTNMIPEPSNYRTWREEMAALEVAAERGSYRESWALPSGQTYRVTGRPHPDGAIALTFEDVTSEISLTRSFRSEIEIAQSVLDTLDEAIAVFSPAGTLWLSNSAYGACWGHSADGLDEIGFRDAIDFWQDGSAPAPIWAEARKFATRLTDRSLVSGRIRRRDGRALDCRFMPLPGGASMVGFSAVTETLGRAPAVAPPAAEERIA